MFEEFSKYDWEQPEKSRFEELVIRVRACAVFEDQGDDFDHVVRTWLGEGKRLRSLS